MDSLVVCRLRKNIKFHLSDTPRKGSLNRRHLSTGNDFNFASAAVNNEQMTGFEGSKAVDCCLKECSTSYNSLSVGQVDSGSESEQRLTNEFSQHDSSSHQDCDDEDDCFAEIMKDDIIKLDESSLPGTPLLPMVGSLSETESKSKQPVQAIMSRVLPFQGTANRRLRLNRRRAKYYHPEPSKAFGIVNDNYTAEGIIPNSQQSKRCSISIFSATMVNLRFVSVFLVILTLLVLFLCLLHGSWKL
ncbi:unnamed protein product [Ilex paraguariensis]|uniref:Uncharacterized protein n=1 Tax=Ilex paraguariensis TaxID=185542 RepID=A0ABC8TPR0_9AQUA